MKVHLALVMGGFAWFTLFTYLASYALDSRRWANVTLAAFFVVISFVGAFFIFFCSALVGGVR